MAYRDAWAIQEQAHAQVVAGGEEQILLVEHPPVITLGRRGMVQGRLLASAEELERERVELVQSDRGGDITYHGPGQLVVYPIIRLADHGLSVSGYVHALEAAVIQTLARYGIEGRADPKAVGIWVQDGNSCAQNEAPHPLAKICAIGVRIRRGVSLHGLALNVTTTLEHFGLIVPCGLAGRPVTSIAKLLGRDTPSMGDIKLQVSENIQITLALSQAIEPRKNIL